MDPTIFKFIFKYSKKQQLILLTLTFISFPVLYLSYDLPKIIVNEAIGGSEGFPQILLGFELGQKSYLLTLCFIFLGLVLINGAFKYALNVYRGVVGERMLRRLRYELFLRVLRFPLPQFRKTSQGEIVSMITAETEPLGGFFGDSVALPAFQGGTLITLLAFMFVQDWVLGVAAVLLYPLQMWMIPKLQRQLNYLKRERTIRVRRLSARIDEVVSGVQELHGHDTSQFELGGFSKRMSEIYSIRYQIYRRKFLIKFLNNFIAQITPFFFFSVGGWLVIEEELTFGALVAVLAAYKDLSSPWKELLTYYQLQSEAKVKYDLLVDTFQPDRMLSAHLLSTEPDSHVSLLGAWVGTNLDLREEDEGDGTYSGNASFKFSLPGRVNITGDAASGKERVAQILAGLKKPLGGTITVDGASLPELPESITGRQIGYVSQEPRLHAGSVKDNLYYSLKHRPRESKAADEEERQRRDEFVFEARASGNSEEDVNADWVDYESAGVNNAEELTDRAIEVLTLVDMQDGIYQLGLQGSVDPSEKPEVAERILEARSALRDRLSDAAIAPLVELFDREKYNTNMSVAENLLFGTPTDTTFDLDNLSANAYVRKVLHEEEDLMGDFIDTGQKLAEIMVDLFADVEPGSELFEQFSFISAEDLPDFRALLARTEAGSYDNLDVEDRNKLMAVPFRLVIARHRLGLIDEVMQQRLLGARRAFEQGFGEGSPAVEFFDRDRFNPQISIQDNILFGRLAYGRARGAVEIGNLIRDVVEKLDLRRMVMEVGLEYQVGIAGARLNAAQRQKLSIARCLLKRPQVMIMDQATAALDDASRATIEENLVSSEEAGLIWVEGRASLKFDYQIVLESGKVVYQGPPQPS